MTMIKDIIKFAWRNVWRNKRRTFLTLTAISLGVLSLVFGRSYILGVKNNATESITKVKAGHIRIVHPEFLRMERILPKEYLIPQSEKIRTTIAQMEGVEGLREEIKFNVLLSHKDTQEPALAIGIIPENTDQTMELSQTIQQGRYLKSPGLELIIGKPLAEGLGVKVGEELLLVTTDINYSTYALPYQIVGIFDTGYPSVDRHTLYIPLPKAQEMLDCGDSAHEILVYIEDTENSYAMVEKIRSQISEILGSTPVKVLPWQEDSVIKTILPMMEQVWGRVLLIVMFVVALVILNTMLMSVMERYHEIGVIKALGFKNGEIFSMIMIEAFTLGIIGSLVGGALGGALAAWVEKVGINIISMMGGQKIYDQIDMPVPFFGKALYTDFTWEILIGAIVFGTVISMVAVLYPARKSIKMKPVEAFRSQLKV